MSSGLCVVMVKCVKVKVKVNGIISKSVSEKLFLFQMLIVKMLQIRILIQMKILKCQ